MKYFKQIVIAILLVCTLSISAACGTTETDRAEVVSQSSETGESGISERQEDIVSSEDKIEDINKQAYDLYISEKYDEAFVLFEKTANMGSDYGQLYLGNCYYFGNGTEVNYEEAVKWYRLSADQGVSNAQVLLGMCYEYGDGIEQNYEEAVKWYRKAADQEDAYGQLLLAYMYDRGLGVEKDYEEAARLYRLSAEQGNASGQYILGSCYEYGVGVEKNFEEAVKWYKMAAAQGNENAIERLKKNTDLSGTEIEENAIDSLPSEFEKTGKDKQTADLTDAAGKEYKYITAQSTNISNANQTSTGTAVANWARVSAKGGKEINCYIPEGVEPEIIELQGVGNLLEDKDGYEWRCISVDVHFNQSFSAIWSWEDFYTLDQYDENMENSNITNGNTKADLGVSKFYVNYNGKKYECLLVSVDSYKAGTGGFNCIECYRVPAGYDGCVFGLIDSREFYLSNDSSYVQGKSDNFNVIDGVLHGLGDVYFRLR